jgi:copper chaperone
MNTPQERNTMKFHIADMTCGHCVSMVTKAILTADGDAKIQNAAAQHGTELCRGNGGLNRGGISGDRSQSQLL